MSLAEFTKVKQQIIEKTGTTLGFPTSEVQHLFLIHLQSLVGRMPKRKKKFMCELLLMSSAFGFLNRLLIDCKTSALDKLDISY